MCILLTVFLSSLVGEIPPLGPKDASIASDAKGNKIAVWVENQTVMLSECSSVGGWSIPTPISSPTSQASDPHVEMDGDGNPTIVWVEENAVRAISKTETHRWEPSLITSVPPSLRKEEIPEEPWEFSVGKNKRKRLRLKTASEEAPSSGVKAFSSNAIDAPSGGTLSGAQIGFAAGTSAPSGGLIVSGQVGMGTSSLGTNFVSISPPTTASWAVNVGGTLSADNGNEEAIFYTNTTMSPNTSSTVNFYGLQLVPTVNLSANSTSYNGIYQFSTINTTGSNFSLTNAYGIVILNPLKLGGGTISNAYGGYFTAPTLATNNCALYSDNHAIGTSYTGITPPSNGMIVQGIVGFGTSAPGTTALFVNKGSLSTSTTATDFYGFINQTTMTYNSGATASFATGQYADLKLVVNTGASLTSATTLNVVAPANTGSGTSITNCKSLNVAAPTIGTTSNIALYSDNISIGYSANTPPTNGLIVQGTAGFSTSGPRTSTRVQVSGTNTVTDGTNTIGYFCDTTFSPSVSSTNASSMYLYPIMTPGTGVTISKGMGLFVDGGSSSGLGTTTEGYGIWCAGPAYGATNRYSGYFTAPSGATHNCALYADNLAIGYTATTPPSTGAIIQGNVGIGVSSISAGALQVAGDITPEANKTRNIGTAALRYNNIYVLTVNPGTSRLAPANTHCGPCQKRMMRGTGTVFTLGEDADYIPVFCLDCGAHRVEALCHLPKEKRAMRKPPPEIKFLGFKVNQHSGNTRDIQVLFSYGNVQNSTVFSDAEYETFQKMDKGAQRAWLRELGQREWDALEEVRLLKEECDSLQTSLDALSRDWVGMDLK